MLEQERRRVSSVLLVGLLVGAIALVYVASYLFLTLGGAYAGSVYGLRVDKDGKTISAPKWYSWAPVGFEADGEWNGALALIYLPLYGLDARYWHTDDLSALGVYPVRRHPADVP
jgi:hypothetical protein